MADELKEENLEEITGGFTGKVKTGSSDAQGKTDIEKLGELFLDALGIHEN